MALSGNAHVTFPGQWGAKGTSPSSTASYPQATGQDFELMIEEFTGIVEGTLNRRSVLADHIPVRAVRGTNTFTNFAVGKSTLQKVTPGEALQGDNSTFGKNALTVDTVIAAREFFPLLDVLQVNFDARREVAQEQGKEIAKFKDEAFFIQALRASLYSTTTYKNGSQTDMPGWDAGTVKNMGAGDDDDAGAIYEKIGDLLGDMEEKDVDPRMDDVLIAVHPKTYYILMQAEQLVNAQYVTAAGNKVNDGWVLKSYGVPVISSNNLPNTNVTGHKLSNSFNGSAYDVNATGLLAVAFSPRAIMAGETIPVTSDIFYDKLYKSWVVDSHLAFAVGPNRTEFAASLWKNGVTPTPIAIS